MEESRLQREDRKVKQYAINYGMTEVQLKELAKILLFERARRRNGSIPPADYFWPDSYPGNYCDTRIQPIPFGELRGTIED